MRKNLTPKGVEALKPAPPGRRVDHMDAIVPGFGVRVTDKGRKSYILVARYPGSPNPTRRAIAEVGKIELGKARDLARDWLELIAAGKDPTEEADRKRREAERERLEAESQRALEKVLDQYENERLSQHRRGAATRRALDGKKGLLKQFRDRDPASLTRAEIREVVKARAKDSPISANRQLAYASAFFNWCRDEEIVAENPVESIRKPSKENERDRYHSLDEVREIWDAAGTLGYPFGQFYRLLITLPMRREEVACIPLNELSLGNDEASSEAIWTLPGDRTKNGQPFRVPLSRLARSIIVEAKDDPARPKSAYLFSTTGETAVSGFAKAKRRLDQAIADARTKAALSVGTDPEPMPAWVAHDLRTTFATLACDRLGIDPAVADRCLNHVASATSSKLLRTYNRSEMFEQRKAALAAWGSLLEAEIVGRRASNVVSLKPAAQA